MLLLLSKLTGDVGDGCSGQFTAPVSVVHNRTDTFAAKLLGSKKNEDKKSNSKDKFFTVCFTLHVEHTFPQSVRHSKRHLF